MPDVTAAIIGAVSSALLFTLANISNRRKRDIRELFHRINALEKEVARLEKPRRLRGI
jgi:polyhydroxyalkanoate synthesis regulator phasin